MTITCSAALLALAPHEVERIVERSSWNRPFSELPTPQRIAATRWYVQRNPDIPPRVTVSFSTLLGEAYVAQHIQAVREAICGALDEAEQTLRAGDEQAARGILYRVLDADIAGRRGPHPSGWDWARTDTSPAVGWGVHQGLGATAMLGACVHERWQAHCGGGGGGSRALALESLDAAVERLLGSGLSVDEARHVLLVAGGV